VCVKKKIIKKRISIFKENNEGTYTILCDCFIGLRSQIDKVDHLYFIISHDVLMADMDSGVEESLRTLEKTRVGKMFIDFAELSMMATGAVDSLIEGVKSFGR
jgi:hypothetical protein